MANILQLCSSLCSLSRNVVWRAAGPLGSRLRGPCLQWRRCAVGQTPSFGKDDPSAPRSLCRGSFVAARTCSGQPSRSTYTGSEPDRGALRRALRTRTAHPKRDGSISPRPDAGAIEEAHHGIDSFARWAQEKKRPLSAIASIWRNDPEPASRRVSARPLPSIAPGLRRLPRPAHRCFGKGDSIPRADQGPSRSRCSAIRR